MAEFTDRIKLVFDAVTSDATSGVGKLKSGVQEAEGGFGKLKAAAGGAVDMIASSPAAMAAAGVAVAKVALDLATGFEQAALSAQDFATASGLSVEQASRWQEVAGDLGVSTETLEGAVNKLNIAGGKGVLTQLGIGGADTNEKLLNALEHLRGIQDASQRATEGAAIFGKSWASLAPLVEESGSLKDNLAAVSDAKVIDEGEVQKAREMRDAMDKLSDTLDDIKLQLGEALIGPITDVATTIGNVVDLANQLKDVTGGVGDVFRMLPGAGIPDMLDGLSRATDFSAGWQEQLKGVGETLTANIPVVGGWASGLFGSSDASDDAAEAAQRHADQAKIQAQAMKDAADAAAAEKAQLDALTTATLAAFSGQLQVADAAEKTTDAVGKYGTAFDTANASAFGNADANKAAADAQRDAEQAALAQAAAQAKLAQDQAVANGATKESVNVNQVQADSLRSVAGTLSADSPLRRSLLAYASQLEAIPASKSTTIDADTETAAQKIAALTQQIFAITGKIFHVQVGASTSTSSAAVTSPSSASAGVSALSASPAPALASAMPGVRASVAGASPSVVVNVYAAPLTNPADIGAKVADYLDAFYRRSGQRRIAAA